jgi:hypothetical protein
MAPTASPSTERVALSRDLAGFLIDLAIALQNHAVYPAGHPFLARSAAAVIGRLDGLLLDRASLSFGVARDRLVIEGVATEPENPVLAGLAGRLHRHRVGAVTLSRGLAAAEVEAVLGALAVEAEHGGALMAGGARPEWPNLRLHPVSFADLQLADGGGEEGDGGPASARAPQLWIGLARAALASAADDADDAEPAAVARAIGRHGHQAAYDQVIVGYLLQLAEELRAGGGHGGTEVRRRLSRMILALEPSTLRRLVAMGGDLVQRKAFVLDASHGFAAEAVVRLVEAAAAASQRTVSDSLLRLLTKLAAHADRSSGPGRAAADMAMREQVARLVEGWNLPSPNPEAYEHALDAAARGDDAAGTRDPAAPEAERMVQTALEVDAGGPMAWDAVREMASDRLHELIALLEDAPAGSRLAGKVWEQVTTPECARTLLRAGPAAAHALGLLCARLGDAAVPALLDELVESESRTVRRAALARLGGMGPAAAAGALRRLDDPRWYVTRNLLGLLGRLGAAPEPAVLAPLLRHDDERVRREAFKLAFPLVEERPRALSLALVDADEQVLRLALSECQAGCPAAVLPLVCRRITDPALDPELRVLAVRALGVSREPLALRTLVHLADGGRSLLGRRRLAAGSPEVVAAVAALAAGWRTHADAAAVLALARQSADAQLRAAAEGAA